MSNVEPLEYIGTMWVTEPENDIDLLMLTSVIDAFNSIGVLTTHQTAILSTFVQKGFAFGYLEEFDKVKLILEVTCHD